MLEGVDDIDWSALQHAYGSAADVPDMLRAIVGKDAAERRAALHAAYGNIFHQGTRYTATPPAIGVLARALADDATPDRAQLLALVVHCVAGYFGPTYGPTTASGTVWGERGVPMGDYGETVALLDACERAAVPAIPVALRLLSHGDPALRVHAAWLVAALWAHVDRDDVRARIEACRATERSPEVRAMLAFALGHTTVPGDPALRAVFATDPEPIARVLAAMGLVRRGEADPPVARALVDWLSDDELDAAYQGLPFGSDALAGDIGALLGRLDAGVLDVALPVLVERLRTVGDFSAVGLLAAALAAVYGDDMPDLEAPQSPPARALLEALAHNQQFWSLGNAVNLLGERGLPTMRDELAERLGIVVVHDAVEAARIGARMFAPFGTERALQAWLEVLDSWPDDREALVEAGALLLESEQYERGLELLQRGAAAGAPEGEHYGKAQFGIGTLQSAYGEYDAAERAFAEAATHMRGRNREVAARNRIVVLQRAGRHDEAIALVYAEEAVTADDWYERGLSEVKAGRHRACIESIGRSLALDPDRGNAHYTIACAHALLGEPEPALAAIERALACDPGLAESIADDSDFASIAELARFRALVGR